MVPALTLYSTEGCHLCENAQAILARVPNAGYAVVDIAYDDELMERYGIRIPVLHCLASNREIAWPFDDESLSSWLAERAGVS